MRTLVTLDAPSIKLAEHVDALSYYGHNVYKLVADSGDSYNFFDNDCVLLEEADDYPIGSAYIGKIIDNIFVPAIMLSYAAYARDI